MRVTFEYVPKGCAENTTTCRAEVVKSYVGRYSPCGASVQEVRISAPLE